MAFLKRLASGKGAFSLARNGESPTRARMRIVLVILAALNAVLLFYVSRPPGRALAERQAELQRGRERYEATLTTVKQMRDLRAKLGSAMQNHAGFSQHHFLDRKSAFSAMLSDLERLASENQLKTSSINYQLTQDPKQPEFVNVAVAMTVEGGYPEMMRLNNKLERSELFWIIDNMNVGPSVSRGLRLNLILQTYAVS